MATGFSWSLLDSAAFCWPNRASVRPKQEAVFPDWAASGPNRAGVGPSCALVGPNWASVGSCWSLLWPAWNQKAISIKWLAPLGTNYGSTGILHIT